MSSVSAACIFDAYGASSAHTDTFYIVSQIIRVRNSKHHFFSKLTFPYIIQPLRFHPTATLTTTAPLRPTATSTTAAPLHPTATSTTAALLSPYGHIDHSPSFRTTKPFEQLRRKFFVFFLKKPLTNTRKPCIMFTVIWVWRRLVARYLGVVEAAGSNPVTQTS